jgi:large subunit ribosomal protein L35
MPKLKTHKSTSKRTTVTSTGKITRRKSSISHFMEKKSESRKRNNRVPNVIHPTRVKSIKRALGMSK